jgi:small ligand-binding sensory domain FIST
VIRAGYGQSLQEGSAGFFDAVTQSVEALEVEYPEVVFLFASGDRCREAEAGLSAAIEAAGTDRVVGCSGMGVLSTSVELEQKSGVVAMAIGGNAVEAVPFLVSAEDADVSLRTGLTPYSSESGLLCVFSTISVGHPGDLIEQLSRDLGFPIVGGVASGSSRDHLTYQWLGSDVRTEAVSGVLLRGEFEILTGVAQGCQPFGQAYTITKAEGNVIYELAFTPAIDALKEALDHLTPSQKENVGPAIFAGIAIDEYDSERNRGDFLIRNLVGMSPEDGSVTIGQRVEVGQTIQFNRRAADAAHLDMEQTTEAVRDEIQGREPKFGLYFNCLGRGFGLYGRPNHDVDQIKRDLGDFPMVGFFGNAEFAPVGGRNFVHSYTGGLVVFTDLQPQNLEEVDV